MNDEAKSVLFAPKAHTIMAPYIITHYNTDGTTQEEVCNYQGYTIFDENIELNRSNLEISRIGKSFKYAIFQNVVAVVSENINKFGIPIPYRYYNHLAINYYTDGSMNKIFMPKNVYADVKNQLAEHQKKKTR